jgi:ATP-binding cassette subfamily B protein
VALVDVTQHLARLSEALATLLVPHRLRDHPEATSLVRSGTVALENIDFCYPDGRRVFSNFSLRIEPGQRVGLVGQSGCGNRPSSCCCSVSTMCRAGALCLGVRTLRG